MENPVTKEMGKFWLVDTGRTVGMKEKGVPTKKWEVL